MLELGVREPDTTAAPPSVELRPLEPDDWPAVAEIYWDGMRDGLAIFETEVRVGSHCTIVIALCLVAVSANDISKGSFQPL